MVTIADLGKIPVVSAQTSQETAPKLCINCKHIGTNQSGSWESYRCFAPQNSSRLNPVTGDKVYDTPYCKTQREIYTGYHCTPNGDWFEQAPPKPQYPDTNPIKSPVLKSAKSSKVSDSLADEL